MLINLNGRLVNYNLLQNVRPTVIHVDFLEKETRDSEKNEYFEVVVMPKVNFVLSFEDALTGHTEQHFQVHVCPKPLGDSEKPGNYWIGFNNAKVGMPDIEYDIVSGTFRWQSHFFKMAWKTFDFDKYDGEHETIEKPHDEDIASWKENVKRKIVKNMPLYVMRALNNAARQCRKA